MERTRTPSTLPDRELVGDSALYARHTAAMNAVKRGVEDDRELLLSYVVWPTELIDEKLEQATRNGLPQRRPERCKQEACLTS